jgi:hypothetical protein
MTTLSRETVRDEIVTAVAAAVAGTGKPFSSVYGYQKGDLGGESPVLLVLSGSIQRQIDGVGTKRYYNFITLELQILVYDGDENQPLTEQEREDKIDACEAALANYFKDHQSGTSYLALAYTPEPTQITEVTYLDGNPYRLEVAQLKLEAKDT